MRTNSNIKPNLVRPVSVIILMALLASGGLAASIVWAGQGDEPQPGKAYKVADSANSHSGVLDPRAVETARTWDQAGVLWLGEQFEGLNLTKAQTVEYMLSAAERRRTDSPARCTSSTASARLLTPETGRAAFLHSKLSCGLRTPYLSPRRSGGKMGSQTPTAYAAFQRWTFKRRQRSGCPMEPQ